MRERLVVTLVAMTVAMIAVFGAARAYSTADLVEDQERSMVDVSADLVAVAVATRGDAEVTAGYLSELTHADQTVTYVSADGTTIRSGAATGHDDDITASRAVEGGGRITLTQSASVSSDRVSKELLPLVVLGITLAILAAIIGWLLARTRSAAWPPTPSASVTGTSTSTSTARRSARPPPWAMPWRKPPASSTPS
jgi:hypothetical protein